MMFQMLFDSFSMFIPSVFSGVLPRTRMQLGVKQGSKTTWTFKGLPLVAPLKVLVRLKWLSLLRYFCSVTSKSL